MNISLGIEFEWNWIKKPRIEMKKWRTELEFEETDPNRSGHAKQDLNRVDPEILWSDPQMGEADPPPPTFSFTIRPFDFQKYAFQPHLYM